MHWNSSKIIKMVGLTFIIFVWIILGLFAYFDFNAFKKIATPSLLLIANTLLVVSVVLAVLKEFLKNNKGLLYGLVAEQVETKSQNNVEPLPKTNQTVKETLHEKAGEKLPLPLFSGAQWEDVTIIQLPSKSFQITVGGKSETFTLSQLNLVNTKNRKPSTLGILFIALCVWKGKIPHDKFEEKYLHQTSQLNKHLQTLFGISDSIFVGHYKKVGAWETKIVFSDRYYQSADIDIQKLQSDFEDSDTD